MKIDILQIDPLTDNCLDTFHAQNKPNSEKLESLLILSKVIKNGFYNKSDWSEVICEAIDTEQLTEILRKTKADDRKFQSCISAAFTILSFLCQRQKPCILSTILGLSDVFKEVLSANFERTDSYVLLAGDVTKFILFSAKCTAGKVRLINEGFVQCLVDNLETGNFPKKLSIHSLFALLSNEDGVMKSADFQVVSETFVKCLHDSGNLDLHSEVVEFFSYYKIFLMRVPGNVDEALMTTNIWRYLLFVAKVPQCVIKIIDMRIVEVFAEIFEKQMFYSTNAFKVLTLLAENDEMWSAYAQVMYKILEKAAWSFKDIDLEDFSKCEDLNKLIPRIRLPEIQNFFRRDTPQSEWIKEGLGRVLSKKMSSDQKYVSFQLTSKLINHFGTGWLIRRDEDFFNTKILAAIFHLTCFEMKNLFDLSQLDQWMGKGTISHYHTCFNIISPLLHFIMAYSESGIFSRKQLKMFYKSFTKVFMAAVKLLETIDRAAKKTSNPVLDFPIPANNSFYLISFLNTCFSRVEFLDSDHKIKALPVIFPVISENVNQMKENNDTFLDLMNNFISPILGLTVNYKTIVILRFNFYRTLCIYLTKVLRQYIRNEFDPLVCDRIVQSCRLLNIIIDSDRNILKDKIFHSLLENVIEFLPSLSYIKDVWICKGSVSLIGMNIIKENGLLIDMYKQESPMKVFFKAILKYLSDSHYFKNFNGRNFLILRTAAKEEQETKVMWTVCMEMLCELLKLLPWTCDMVLTSGWSAHLLRDLTSLESVGENQYFVNKVEMILVRLVLMRNYQKSFQKMMQDFDISWVCKKYSLNVLKAIIHPNFGNTANLRRHKKY